MKSSFIVLLCMAIFLSCNEKEEPIKPMEIQMGEQFILDMEANWSTGYSWVWENSLEVSAVDTTERIYIQSYPGSGRVSGVEEWIFIGKRNGKESI